MDRLRRLAIILLVSSIDSMYLFIHTGSLEEIESRSKVVYSPESSRIILGFWNGWIRSGHRPNDISVVMDDFVCLK